MKNTHFCILVLVVCLELGFSIHDAEAEEQIACTLEYVPVCGVDGLTYGNKCQLNAAEVNLDYLGECLVEEKPIQYPINIMIDKSEYDDCDTIYISGKIENFNLLPFDSEPNKTYMSWTVIDEANNHVTGEPIDHFRDFVRNDGTFVGEINRLNYWFPHNGEYTVFYYFSYPEDSTEDSMVLSTKDSTTFSFKDTGVCEPFNAEKTEKIRLEEEKELHEKLITTLTTGFPQKVESRCDLVYLIAKSWDAGNMGMLPLPDSDMKKLLDKREYYLQQISDKPWLKEQLGREGTEKAIKMSTEYTMKTYSIDQKLYPIVSDMYFLGAPNYEKGLGLVLMNPEDYTDDLECGNKIIEDHSDFLHSAYVSYYGETDAETIEQAIDAALDQAEGIHVDSTSAIKCGTGTIEKNGQCVRDPDYKSGKSSLGGGCLIATATYGSELAPQVQQLRELRDNSLLQTESGTSFMSSFNQFYYSFSPTIADWERENPIFKEAVKLTLTPMISSLSILNYVDMDSEVNVLGYGISLIILNVGMYFVAPGIVIHQIKKKF